MATIVITENLKDELVRFLKKNKKTDLSTIYCYYLEKKHQIKPVLFIRDKTIYQSQEKLLETLEGQGKLWRETEIKIQLGQQNVNEQTKKVYICPFCGKVYADNTYLYPQDEICHHLSKQCKDNTQRVNGLPAKTFLVSEDAEVIRSYIPKQKEAKKKIVYSSAVTGKLFNSKQAVLDDFIKNQIKPYSFSEIPNNTRFNMEESFLAFSEKHFNNIPAFYEVISRIDEFDPYMDQWSEEINDEGSEES
jgi:hypothetical protein